jgi:hypothetical protein
VRLAVVDVLAEHGDGLSVGLGVEGVASLKKHQLEFLVYIPRQELLSTDQIRGWNDSDNPQFVMIPSD